MNLNQELTDLLIPKNLDEQYSLSTEDICSPNSFSFSSQNYNSQNLQKSNSLTQVPPVNNSLIKSYIQQQQQLYNQQSQEIEENLMQNQKIQPDNFSTLNNFSQNTLSFEDEQQDDEESGEDIFFTKNGQPSTQIPTINIIQQKIEEEDQYTYYIYPAQPKIEEQQIQFQQPIIETHQQQFQLNNFYTNTNNYINNFEQIIKSFESEKLQQQNVEVSQKAKQQKKIVKKNINEIKLNKQGEELTYIQKQQLQSQQNSQTETKNLVKNLGTPLIELLTKYFKPLDGIEYKKLKEMKKLKRKEDLVLVFQISEKVQIKSVEFLQRLIPYIANSKRIVNKKAHMKYIDILIMAAMDPENFKTFKPVYI